MKKIVCLAIVTILASLALVACRGSDTAEPTAATEAAPAAQPTSAPATAPTVAPTAMPAPTSAPTATPAPTAAPAPVPTEPTGPAAAMGMPSECLPGGMLDDVATIAACAAHALQQALSFSFDGELNLLALFPVEGAGPEGVMSLSGAIVRPDKLRFEISFAPEGQTIEIAGVVIGADTYVRDPESGTWLKGTPPDADDFLSSIQMVGMLQLPQDSPATLDESVSLDDGTKGYVLSYDQAGQQGGMAALGLGGSSLIMVIGADDFLTREVRVVVKGANDEAADLIAIRYHGYNETQEIEPPSEYMTLPAGPMTPPAMAEPMVLGLARNADGDVEVLFSVPVQIQGQVELYVIDPATGGWGLPLLSGSGTNILTFDGDAEGRQTLIAGESQIAGFTFPTPDSQMTDAGGARLDLTFDIWIYE